LKRTIKSYDTKQFLRIKNKETSTRNSLLFISLIGDVETIAEQVYTLSVLCYETAKPMIQEKEQNKKESVS
jgi:hypothetical protein